MTTPVYAISANSLTAETFRQAPSSLISGTGVVGSGDLQVTQNGVANMSVNVAAGQVWVPGTLSSTTGFPTNRNAQTTWGLPSSFNEQGSYMQWYSGTTNLAIAAADPTNPRIDLAVVSIQDAAYSGSNNQGILQIITGTPAPSPSAPSAPAASVVLAQIAVAAGASSIVNANITDERVFLSVADGLRPSGHATQTVAQSIPAATFTGLTNTSADFVRGGVTYASNAFTVPTAGVYLCHAVIEWNNASTYDMQTTIAHNGSSVVAATTCFPYTGQNAEIEIPVTEIIVCAANDTLSWGAYVSAGPISTVVSNNRTRMFVTKISN